MKHRLLSQLYCELCNSVLYAMIVWKKNTTFIACLGANKVHFEANALLQLKCIVLAGECLAVCLSVSVCYHSLFLCGFPAAPGADESDSSPAGEWGRQGNAGCSRRPVCLRADRQRLQCGETRAAATERLTPLIKGQAVQSQEVGSVLLVFTGSFGSLLWIIHRTKDGFCFGLLITDVNRKPPKWVTCKCETKTEHIYEYTEFI